MPSFASSRGDLMERVHDRFCVWKRVTIKRASFRDLMRLLEENGYLNESGITAAAFAVMHKVEFDLPEMRAELVMARNDDFSLWRVPRSSTMLAARAVGLQLCPQRLAPWLRLAYDDQPVLERAQIAMAPIIGHDDAPAVFSLDRLRDRAWLDVTRGSDESTFGPNTPWIFMRKVT